MNTLYTPKDENYIIPICATIIIEELQEFITFAEVFTQSENDTNDIQRAVIERFFRQCKQFSDDLSLASYDADSIKRRLKLDDD